MFDEAGIRQRYEAVRQQLDERGRRLFAAAEVRALGRGGLAAVSKATGIARSTMGRGLKDLDLPPLPTGHVRRPGSGRRTLTAMDATLLDDLRRIIEPAIRDDPMRPLLWVSKSHAKLAAALRSLGQRVSHNTVRKLLRQLGFHRQVNRTAEGNRLVRYWARYGFRVVDKPPVIFSDYRYVPMVCDLPEGPDRLSVDSDDMVLIRPEGDWDRPGVLDLSAARGVAHPHPAE